jgi:TRAP-type uncharacterized transport system substrate-binding protein
MPTHESAGKIDNLLSRILSFLHYDRRVRITLGMLMVAALLFLAGRSVYGLIPRYYTLTISGGDIVGNRHYLARILQSEAHKKNLTLIVRPEEGSLSALKKVSEGKLDLAFIQGGMNADFPNVEHAATVAPEQVHLLVKRGIGGMEDLRGRSINLGTRNSIERDVSLTITQFAGYEENIDYVETNYNQEQLLSLPDRDMPDAMFIISSVPSYLVEFLVRDRDYDVMEIPFPESLALRYGWAANSRILSYTYNLDPPVPAKTIQTVAVNVHLVANAKVDPQAISRLLEVLFSPSVANQIRQPLDQGKIAVPSGYPISRGLTAYLTRNDSIITLQTWNKLMGLFGILMSVSGMLIVFVKWFKIAKGNYDGEYMGYLREAASIARAVFTMEAEDKLNRDELTKIRDRLGELRATMVERYPGENFKDPRLFDRCMSSARAVHDHVGRLLVKWELPTQFQNSQFPGPP